MEAPGQFLRHYSPDIDSFLFKGFSDESKLDVSECVMLDFGEIFISLKDKVKYYVDLSSEGEFLEAINVIYDKLRWCETKKDANCVLITNFMESTISEENFKGKEHKEALFDRIFRATSGKEIA